jgi:integrase
VTLFQLFERHYLPHVTRKLKPKTVTEYERLARTEVLPRLGARELSSLTFRDAEALHGAVPGRVQANRAVSLLSAMLGYAAKRDYVDMNTARGVDRNRETGREFFYSPDQTRALLRAAAAWDDPRARYIALELLTGCRPGELLDATVGWRRGSVLRTPDGKTGGRTIYLSPAAEAVLDVIEPEPRTGRYFPAGMSLRRAWERLCREARVPRARQYDLRHTFASAALAAGETIAVIAEMLGHRKLQTTLRYAHLSPDIGLRGAAAAAARMGA